MIGNLYPNHADLQPKVLILASEVNTVLAGFDIPTKSRARGGGRKALLWAVARHNDIGTLCMAR